MNCSRLERQRYVEAIVDAKELFTLDANCAEAATQRQLRTRRGVEPQLHTHRPWTRRKT
jgi:hypothetical protein